MEETRDEILATFQTCTGLDDITECIQTLESTEWNLLEAINVIIPQETQVLLSERQPSVEPMDTDNSVVQVPVPAVARSSENDVMVTNDDVIVDRHVIRPSVIKTKSESSLASSQTNKRPALVYLNDLDKGDTRMITFNVQFDRKVFPVEVAETETVGALKLVLEGKVGVKKDKQVLRGWQNNCSMKINDHTRLDTLKLPNIIDIYLEVASNGISTCRPMQNGNGPGCTERMTQTFKLDIHDETHSKDYSINFTGNKTISEVKQDVYNVTGIQVRNQVWSGWPVDISADDTLPIAFTGIGYPCQALRVKQKDMDRTENDLRSAPIRNRLHTKTPDEILESESSDDFEDANENLIDDEDFFSSDPAVDQKPRPQPLMPDDIEDETQMVLHFTQEFANRFGYLHPMFYEATLEEALKEACMKRAKDRKILAIYLHNDKSVLSNVFCTQMLCNESVVTYLSNNFVIWPWDTSSRRNKNRVLELIQKNFGGVTSNSVRSFKDDQFPVLVIVTRNRSNNEVFTVQQGSASLDDLMSSLIQAVEFHSDQLQVEIREENDRLERDTIMQDQNRAYRESLEADRQKKLKQDELIERERKETIDKQVAEEIKIAVRQSLKDSIPPEPPADCDPQTITQLRFRCPENKMILRRFLVTCTLGDVLNFMTVEGYAVDEFKMITSYPRKDLTTIEDRDITLKELNLFPQETLTMEER